MNLFKTFKNRMLEGHIKEHIKTCPWKEDISIEQSSFILLTDKKPYHSVSCTASGPNYYPPDTFHSDWIDKNVDQSNRKTS